MRLSRAVDVVTACCVDVLTTAPAHPPRGGEQREALLFAIEGLALCRDGNIKLRRKTHAPHHVNPATLLARASSALTVSADHGLLTSKVFACGVQRLK